MQEENKKENDIRCIIRFERDHKLHLASEVVDSSRVEYGGVILKSTCL